MSSPVIEGQARQLPSVAGTLEHPRGFSRSCVAAILAVISFLASGARAEPEKLRVAKYHFEYGKYADSLKLVEDLLRNKLIADGPDLVEAYRIQGLSHFYLGHRADARTSFVNLLSVEPDFVLDPLLVPPLAIVEFDAVKKENDPLLASIRDRRRAIAEQKRLEEEARRKLIEDEERRRKEKGGNPELMRVVERRSRLTSFLPLGGGQLEQGRTGAGLLFAAGETLAVAGSILAFAQVKSRIGSDGRVASEDLVPARNWKLANQLTVALAGALYLGGVLDAVLRHEPELVSFESIPRENLVPVPKALPPGSSPPGHRSPRPPTPVPAGQTRPTTLLFVPLPDGAAAGLSLAF
jgi:hypothetical protein